MSKGDFPEVNISWLDKEEINEIDKIINDEINKMEKNLEAIIIEAQDYAEKEMENDKGLANFDKLVNSFIRNKCDSMIKYAIISHYHPEFKILDNEKQEEIINQLEKEYKSKGEK